MTGLDAQPDSPAAPLTRGKAYTGEGVTVYFDASRCIHVANCVRGLPQVFRPRDRPWVQAWNAPAAEVAAVVRTCPTGALHYVLEGGPAETPDQPTTITPVTDGPLNIRGDLVIKAPGGEVREVRAALCRCGASHNKPFCDGTHAKIGWKSGGEAPRSQRGDDRPGEGQRADGAQTLEEK
ncbi:(4Fe-4S)-binding protein [Deinococcus aluminii]|uniref:Iron-binding zinc finger CDGSH type domain-containing protein n=1 Tax=Deinococcus aluminii TaxID=1656885 RepID=A0ABP9XDR7_9DEIO